MHCVQMCIPCGSLVACDTLSRLLAPLDTAPQNVTLVSGIWDLGRDKINAKVCVCLVFRLAVVCVRIGGSLATNHVVSTVDNVKSMCKEEGGEGKF